VLAEAAEAFCLEDEVALSGDGGGTGSSKAELLAQSVPYDPARALSVVKVRLGGGERARASRFAIRHDHILPTVAARRVCCWRKACAGRRVRHAGL
jgi:hypothetical protein